jgi:hypothetical protein
MTSSGVKNRQDFIFTTQGVIPMRNETDFVPGNDIGKAAVEKARRIVKENNEMIIKLKEDANISCLEVDTFSEASNFSYEDSYAFDLHKIKSSNGFNNFFKDIFGVF